MSDITFGIIEIAILIATLIGVLFAGRWVKSWACRFMPTDPLTVFFYTALVGVTALLSREGMMTSFVLIWIGVAAVAYLIGYAIGDFSKRGVVEMSLEKDRVRHYGHRIAYYYNSKLKSYCIQTQSFWNGLRRLFLNVHDTLEFPFERAQVMTEMVIDNDYIKLKLKGAMTYFVVTEERRTEDRRIKWRYTHHRYIPMNITELGPYDMYAKVSLYLTALDIATKAQSMMLAADVNKWGSEVTGGATLLRSIAKLTPENAAAALDELEKFVIDDSTKTVAHATAEKKEVKRKWWPWKR